MLALISMTLSQIIVDNAQTLARFQTPTTPTCETRGERESHQQVSESHKPPSENKERILLATKSEMRELRGYPSITHYVLMCKGEATTNSLTNVPPSLLVILQEFKDVFPDKLPHRLPPLRGIEHYIDLIQGTPLPNHATYRTNADETKEIEWKIQDLLSKGVIRESLSHCAVPVILVPKSDSTLRMSMDCRPINAITIRYHHPIPRLDDMFDDGDALDAKIEEIKNENCSKQS